MQTYQVTTEEAQKRLDLFLALKQNEFSRSAIRQQLNAGRVKVNDQLEYRPNYKVKLGDIINTEFVAAKPLSNIKPQNIKLNIIFEDEDLLVVNKPVGMVVHPANGNETDTLMNAILYHYSSLQNVGNKLRSGLIHRLDKDTSGIVLVGKSNKALWHYSKQFAERIVSKEYLAVVPGDFTELLSGKASLTVQDYLGRNLKNRKKIARVNPGKGRISETEFFFLKHLTYENQQFSLVKAKPKTGRTHQIRVHLSGLGFPILGDKIYGRAHAYPRLMLHAWKLTVPMLNGAEKVFVANIPKVFEDLHAKP